MLTFFQKLPLSQKHCMLLSLFGFIVCIPALIIHFPDSHDGIFALIAFNDFSTQFYAGEYYPRWLYGLYNGHGGPMFYYYPPFPFYLETMIDLLTLRALPDLLILGLAALFFRITAALACYYWLKQELSARAAFIAALMYTILPNHLVIDLYMKGTLTELSAYTFIPLCMIFMHRCSRSAYAWIGVAISYALVITSSIPMALAFTPFLMIYALYLHFHPQKQTPGHNKKSILGIAAGLCAGFSLAGFHIITAYGLSDIITQEKFWTDFYNPRNWFICLSCEHMPPRHGALNQIFTKIFVSQLFACLGMAIFVFKNATTQTQKYNAIFWGIIALGTVFMMSRYSILLWDYLPLLERIQFPWRLALGLELAFVFLLASCFTTQKITKIGKIEWFALFTFMVFFVISIQTAILNARRAPLYSADEFNTMLERADYMGVYIPSYSPVLRPQLIARDVPFITLNGDAQNSLTYQDLPYGKRFHIKTPEPTTIHIRQLYYPSWIAYSEENAAPYKLSIDPDYGTIQIEFPGGEDTIILRHKTLPQEKTGILFSMTAIMVLAAGALWVRTRRKQQR